VHCDVGISGGLVTTLGQGIAPGAREIDCRWQSWCCGRRRQPLPHRAEILGGILCADDFYSATVAAAVPCATTTVIPVRGAATGASRCGKRSRELS